MASITLCTVYWTLIWFLLVVNNKMPISLLFFNLLRICQCSKQSFWLDLDIIDVWLDLDIVDVYTLDYGTAKIYH